MTANGSCLCAGVRFSVAGPLRAVIACHCGQCRKTSGHYVAATSAARGDVRFAAEAPLRWFDSSATARRGFCETCGSSLFWEEPGSGRLSIHVGCLDDATGLTTAAHIFCADKGDYYELPHDAPHFAGDDRKATAT
jgi:hypothetical protein